MKRFDNIECWVLALWIGFYGFHCVAEEAQAPGDITVAFKYAVAPDVFVQSPPTLQILFLSDHDDIFSQIEALKEQSKAELEPLVKQYMYAAETLMTSAAEARQADQQTQKRAAELFKTAETHIEVVLARYQLQIDSLMQQHTLMTAMLTLLPAERRFTQIQAGKYRVYAVLTFSTTALRWFEPVEVKGGGRHTITLTRENLMNPYWTDLNWWSFMNLDFSKHHP
jgi:hypothetical protein